jgi:N-acetylglucosamine-6-phosphate deacetylase
MKCSGVDALSGAAVNVEYEVEIRGVGTTPFAECSGGRQEYLAPGFIDLQVNGYAGVDYNTGGTPLDEIGRSIREQYAAGVTRLLPTLITNSEEEIVASLRNLACARERLPEGRSIAGFHIEGPHISSEDGPRGAHPRRWVRRPDIEEFHRWQEAARGGIRVVTVSPEWPEAPKYIEHLVSHGVVASIGHTQANRAQLEDAVAAGATMCTHLGNGAHNTLPRHPNYIWDQLSDDRLTAGFIVDGVHLPGAFVKAAIRAKQVSRSFLVTDAVMPAGCVPGRYRLGDVEVDLLPPGDRVVVAGTSQLSGSALNMDWGISKLMELADLSLSESLRMVTVNPARAARIAGRQRGLQAGDSADLVRFTFDPSTHSIRVLETIVEGGTVYRA